MRGRLVGLVVALGLLAGAAPAVAATPRLVVERTGGFAGVQDRITIGEHGVAVVVHRQKAPVRLAAQRTRAARTALREARFDTLDAEYAPLGGVDDGFLYVLRSGGHTVRVEDGADDVPVRLQRLIAAVSTLLQA